MSPERMVRQDKTVSFPPLNLDDWTFLFQRFEGLNENEIVTCAKRGNPDAFIWLYLKYFPYLARYNLSKTGDPSVAEEVAQETLLHIHTSLSGFKEQPGASFASWVFSIDRNLLIDEQRKSSKRRQLTPITGAHEATIPDPDIMPDLIPDDILQALQLLTTNQRAVTELKFLAGLPTSAVAKILGKSESNIRSIQHLAIQNLRIILKVNPQGKNGQKSMPLAS